MDQDALIYGFTRNVVVAASAGTGKTHRLTCLYVMLTLGLTSMGRRSRREAHPPIAPERIVATTFSRAAALEIRTRIERSLRDLADGSPRAPFQAEIAARLAELDDAPSAGELAARARRALASLHEARIETLHGLAADLLRRHAYGLGLSPALRVLEEAEAESLANGVIDEVLAEALESEGPRREAVQTLTAACGGLFGARTRLRPYFARLDEEGLDVGSLRPIDHLGQARALYQRLAAAVEQATGSPRPQIAGPARALAPHLSRAVPDDLALSPAGEAALLELFTQRRGSRKPEVADAEGPVLDLRDGLPGNNTARAKLVIATLREAATLQAREREVVALLQTIRERLAREHEARGVASFGDLLRLARDGLRDYPEVALAAKEELDVLMVDEFQDTSLVQRDLVYLLRGREGARAAGAEVEPEHLERHGLFVVGDRKQSIYAFRGADVAVFNRVCGELCGEAARVGLGLPEERCSRPPSADLVALTVSYRSGPSIVRFVNALCALDFASAAGADPEVGVAYGPAEHLASARPAGGDRVVFVHDDDGPIDDPLLASAGPELRQAFSAAALARELTAGGAGFELRDVAILARRRATIPLLEVALTRLGLPYVVAGRALFDTLEVRDLAALARLLQDPHDRSALAHVLRGPIVALSDGALLSLSQPRGLRRDLLAAGQREAALDAAQFPEEAARLELFRERFVDLRPTLLRLSAADALRTALRAFDLDRVMAALPRAASRIGNLDRLLGIAGERGGSLLAFSRWLDRQIAEETDEPEAVVFSPDDDAVRLLTIHGAKGLDFPACVVVDLGSTAGAQYAPLDFLRVEGEPGAQAVFDLRGERRAKLASPVRLLARERANVRSTSERARVSYVAVTRAKQLLGLIGSPRKVPRKSLLSTFQAHQEGELAGLFETRSAVELMQAALSAPPPAPAAPPAEPGGPRARRLPLADDMAIATTPLGVLRGCARRFALRFLHGLEEPVDSGQLGLFELEAPAQGKRVEPFERGDEDPDPRDSGRAVHRVLETLPVERLARGDLSPAELRAALIGEGVAEAQAEELSAGVALFVRGAYAGELARAARFEREAEVVLTRAVAGAPRLCLRGTVDAFAVFDDRVDLVDYKLARPSPTLEPYAFQLRAYALALAERAPGRRVRAGILFVGAASEPRWLASRDGGDTLGADDHEAFGGELSALAQRLARCRAADEWPMLAEPECRRERCGFVTACHRAQGRSATHGPRRARR